MSSPLWSNKDTESEGTERISSHTMDSSFFLFSSCSSLQSRVSLTQLTPRPDPDSGGLEHGANESLLLESDLVLAAELGRALLGRNEELGGQLEKMDRDIEALQQEKHELQRKLEVRELEAGQREAELQADITALREQLDKHSSQGWERRREENGQLTELANRNQRLVEQLAEAVSLEHSLRSELRSLREEVEDGSFSHSISSTRLDSLQAENRVLREQKANAEQRLRLSQEECSRLRQERNRQRERVEALQSSLNDREAELDQERSAAFQLRSHNHALQQKVEDLGEEVGLEEVNSFPLSLHCELQQSQAKETIAAHSEILQEKERTILKLKEELHLREAELQSVKEELQPLRPPPGKPSYSSLESQLAQVQRERDSLNQQLISTIKHKMMLSQEVDAWQEDMRLVIREQVQMQEKERRTPSRDSRTSKSLRVRSEGARKAGFFSFFKHD